MFIPDPGSEFFHPGSKFFPSRIRIKEFKYFKTKNFFLSSRKYRHDPNCSSRIRIFLHNPDLRGQKGTGSRIRNLERRQEKRRGTLPVHIFSCIYSWLCTGTVRTRPPRPRTTRCQLPVSAPYTDKQRVFHPYPHSVLRTRIRMHRIHMFLGLLDPDPSIIKPI
jgi:hypothetical protein